MAGDESPGVVVTARSRKFNPHTRRGRAQAIELSDELEILANQRGIDVRALEISTDADDGQRMKGDPVTVGVIVLALINAGAATAVINCFKGWLDRRPMERELSISGSIGDECIDLTVTAANVDGDALGKTLVAAIESHDEA